MGSLLYALITLFVDDIYSAAKNFRTPDLIAGCGEKQRDLSSITLPANHPQTISNLQFQWSQDMQQRTVGKKYNKINAVEKIRTLHEN